MKNLAQRIPEQGQVMGGKPSNFIEGTTAEWQEASAAASAPQVRRHAEST
jgi:hypothetical protein